LAVLNKDNNAVEEQERHFLQRWFSIGDAISLVAMLVALGMTFGSLSKDVDSIKMNVAELRAQRITPGAEIAMATIRAKDDAQDKQLDALRQEMMMQRREILDGINAIDAKLDAHMDRNVR
jgi:hypothetical protein